MNEQLKQALKAVKVLDSKPEFDEATVERLIREALEGLPQLAAEYQRKERLFLELLIVPYKNKEAEEAARRLTYMFQEAHVYCRLIDREGRGNNKSLQVHVMSVTSAARLA